MQVSTSLARATLDLAPDTPFDVRTNSSKVSLPTKASATKGYLCIRPASLLVQPSLSEVKPEFNSLQATVVRSSYKGSEYDIEVAISDDFRLRGSCRASGSAAALPPNSAVSISWRSEDGFFISETPH
jgi:hypothetical protein